MAEPMARRTWVRRRGWLLILVSVMLGAGALGARYVPQFLDRRAVTATVSGAAEVVEALSGVTSAEATVDHRIRSHRQERRERLTGAVRPRGEVTVDIVLASDIVPEQLAEVLRHVRSELADSALERHAVSMEYTQLGSERRVFDGWGVAEPVVSRPAEQLDRIAAYALGLPDGAWFDLDPATFEQGQFADAGPPLFRELLGREVHGGFTVGARLGSATAGEALDEAVRLTSDAADVLDGPTALHLLGPNDMIVRTATEPEGLDEAWREIAVRAHQLADADELSLSFEAAREWPLGGDALEGTTTVTLTLEGAGSCADDDAYRSLSRDATRILDEQSIQHAVDIVGCP